eukprot:9496374-Pyramimonas_sp.AAC.1
MAPLQPPFRSPGVYVGPAPSDPLAVGALSTRSDGCGGGPARVARRGSRGGAGLVGGDAALQVGLGGVVSAAGQCRAGGEGGEQGGRGQGEREKNKTTKRTISY